MDRAIFERHFHEAAAIARDCAQQFLEESLPPEMRFRVHLNSSYDENADDDFELFPNDSSRAVGLANKDLSAAGVVDLLFRDGRVPQCIRIEVAKRA